MTTRDPSLYVISLDIKAAFQTISRASVTHGLQDHSVAHQAFKAWYPHSTPTRHRLQLADESYRDVSANQGVDQGDPLASYGYTKGSEEDQNKLETELRRLHPKNRLLSYLDDSYIVCRQQDISHVLAFVPVAYLESNQHLQESKLKIWSPQPASDLPASLQPLLVRSFKCLGTHLRLAGDSDHSDLQLTDPEHPFRTPITRIRTLTRNITALQAYGLKQQTAITLLQAYASSAAQHIARNYFLTDRQGQDWDEVVMEAWSAILNKHHTTTHLTALPRKLGGAGATDMQSRHHAAVWSAWTGALPHILLVAGMRDAQEFTDQCPDLTRALQTTQEGLAQASHQPTLSHRPLHSALTKHIKQKQHMQQIHKTLHSEHLANLPIPAQAMHYSRSAPGAAAFLTAPPKPGGHNAGQGVQYCRRSKAQPSVGSP